MKIQAIKPQTNTFQANKKFRIYSDSMELIDLGSRVTFSNNTRWAKEYENPYAKDLYLKAKATKNWKEKMSSYVQIKSYILPKHLKVGKFKGLMRPHLKSDVDKVVNEMKKESIDITQAMKILDITRSQMCDIINEFNLGLYKKSYLTLIISSSFSTKPTSKTLSISR